MSESRTLADKLTAEEVMKCIEIIRASHAEGRIEISVSREGTPYSIAWSMKKSLIRESNGGKA